MSLKSRIFKYALAYIFAAFSTLLGALVLNLLRDTLLLSMVAAVADADKREQFYQGLRIGAAVQWTVVLLGLFLLILLIGMESLYRNSVAEGKLWDRFFLVTGIELALLFVTHAIFYILQATFAPQDWMSVAVPVIEAVLAGLCLGLWRHGHRVKGLIKGRPGA